MLSRRTDNARARAWSDELGADALVATADSVRGLAAALQDRVRGLDAAPRAVFADLAIARWLETRETTLEELAALIRWSLPRRLPRHAGGLPADQLLANAWLGSALREAFARQLPRELAALDLLRIPDQLAILHAWDAIFLNSLSPLHLAPSAPVAARCDGVAGWLVESLCEPFAAPRSLDVEAMWRSDAPIVAKVLVAMWAIALPVHELAAPAAERVVDLVTRLCPAMRAAPPPTPLAFAFCHALTAALFRAAYAAVDHTAALAAAGDLVTDLARRHLPAYARPRPRTAARARPRIGYMSTNFRGHAVALYMASRILDRSRAFDVTTIVLGEKRDQLTAAIMAASDAHVELANATDYAAIADAVIEADLDLLVYADLGMELATTVLAGLHLAPRQIVLMGHAASSGMPTISHYVGGDHEADDAQRHYREHLVRLPTLGAAQQPPPVPAGALTRAHLGIPAEAVVLVNCGNAIKHGADRDDLLAEILARAPDAWLVLKPFFSAGDVDPRIVDRLRGSAARRGVAERLLVVPPVASSAHVMDLYALADLQLDTYPFGGWTTNLEALYLGVPIVTREGPTGRSRMGAAMLRRLGISDGIAHDDATYVAEAVRLARDHALRANLRTRLAAARTILFAPNATQAAYEATLREILA